MALLEKDVVTETTAEYYLIGKGVPRRDGDAKATGALKYLDDLVMPGMLYGAILRSPHPHARIRRIDTSRARQLPGVRAVITAADTPKLKFAFVAEQADQLPLCDDKVRYIGDEVAAVAAESPEIAQRALELIDVEYEPLPAVFTPEEALKPGAPLVHDDHPDNIAAEVRSQYGDPEAAFAQAAYVFEDRFDTSRPTHCCLERRGCIAYFEVTGHLTVWSPTQTPHLLRHELSRTLGIPTRSIRVIRTPIGGGFGNRLVMDMKEPIAALLSRKTKRPVKIVNTRAEEFTTSRSRYPWTIWIKTAVDRDGRLLARSVRAWVDNGAYCDKGYNTIKYAETVNATLYQVPNVAFHATLVYTNNQYGTGFRGFGNPQITFAIESQMDLIAHRLGMDPLELRLRNANRRDQPVVSGIPIDNDAFTESLQTVAERCSWSSRPVQFQGHGSASAGKRGKVRGIGLAMMVQSGAGSRGYGFNATEAFVKIHEDGQVTLITSAVEMGQGPATAMAQIVGEVLGVPVESIQVVDDDTAVTPYDLGAWGSRTTWVHGHAVRAAAEDARREMLEVAGRMLEASPDDLTIKDGYVVGAGRRVPVPEVLAYAVNVEGRTISGRGRYWDEKAPRLKAGEPVPVFPSVVFGAQAAEVEVDLDTGEVRVLKITAAHEVGKALNPRAVTGQLEGAIVQGIGYALTEDLVVREGRVLNPGFLDYKILSAADVPEMDIQLIETRDTGGPFDAKGVGEQGIVPTAAAIANAVFRATGVRVTSLPITPEKILRGLGRL